MIFVSTSTKTLIVSITIALVSSSSSRAFVTTSRITFSKRANSNVSVSRKLMMSSSSSSSFLDTVSNAASEALGKDIQLVSTIGGGASGGGGATTGAVLDKNTNTKYFIKSTSARNGYDMLRAEYEGVKAMSNTNTIRVPTPITFGTYKETNQSFVLFEYLEFCGGGSQYELGVALAKMHKDGLSYVSPNSNNDDDDDDGRGGDGGGGGGGKFGFHVNNTIGATFQPNLPWYDDWADFWDEHRLGHMLKLTNNAGGLSNEKIIMLRQKTRELLSSTNRDGDPIIASIVHGDLWGGNKGFFKDNKDDDDDNNNNNNKVLPVIFDPAAYYGDREVDVAMTYLFGGFNGDFYEGYNSEWPLPTGHEKRRTIYNLYHILNHDVLFGGGYINQARSMIEQILRY
jgi:fructosamine-3-kinase